MTGSSDVRVAAEIEEMLRRSVSSGSSANQLSPLQPQQQPSQKRTSIAEASAMMPRLRSTAEFPTALAHLLRRDDGKRAAPISSGAA